MTWLRIARSGVVGMFVGLLAFAVFGLIVLPRWTTLSPDQHTLAWIIWSVTVVALATHGGWLVFQAFRVSRRERKETPQP